MLTLASSVEMAPPLRAAVLEVKLESVKERVTFSPRRAPHESRRLVGNRRWRAPEVRGAARKRGLVGLEGGPVIGVAPAIGWLRRCLAQEWEAQVPLASDRLPRWFRRPPLAEAFWLEVIGVVEGEGGVQAVDGAAECWDTLLMKSRRRVRREALASMAPPGRGAGGVAGEGRN